MAARNAFDSTSERPNPVQRSPCLRGVFETRKQVFESAHKIAQPSRAVTNCDVLQKNIYKSFKQEPPNRFFQMLHPAMGISDYRNNDFRVSFGRVTPVRCCAKNMARAFISVRCRSTFLQAALLFPVRQICIK
ncbi:MAG: hypothetical protein ACM3OF_08430 [Gemmatimonas sp.]